MSCASCSWSADLLCRTVVQTGDRCLNVHCLCPFRPSAVPWRRTWSSSSKMRSVMECVSAGTCGPPAGWRPQGWLSPWPVFWPRWRSVLTCHLCSMNRCFVADQRAKRCSTHSGMNFLARDVKRGWIVPSFYLNFATSLFPFFSAWCLAASSI